MNTAPDTGEQEPTELGPAMQSLPNDTQRAFVCALYDEDAPRKGDGLLIYAARAAGYGTPTSSTKSLGVIANRIVHDCRVQAAIVEHSRSALRAVPPEAIRALKELIRDPKHGDHARAIAMVVDRTDPLQTVHTVKVEDSRPPSPEITQKVLDPIDELARRAGLLPAPKIINGGCDTAGGALMDTADSAIVSDVAQRHLLDFIGAALAKRVLQYPDIPPASRLELLERLNGLTDSYFSADALQMIAPMCDTGLEIFKEAKSLDTTDETYCSASFEILTRPAVLDHLISLNPTLLAAVKHCHAKLQNQHAPQPTPDETPPPRPTSAMGAAQFALMQRRSNGTPSQHRSHHPPDQIGRMGGGLPDWSYDSA